MFARHQRPYILYFQWVATNTCCRRRTPTLPHCGQMGNVLPTSFGTLRALLPTCLWGQSPNSRSSPQSCCPPPARFASPPTGSFCSALLWGYYCAVSVKTAGVATPVAVAVMVMVLGDGGRV